MHLRCVAVVGAQSADLQRQIDAVDPDWPEVAVIAVGANDVTHRIPPGRSVALLTAAIERLREHDVEVVVATCPDLGTIRPIPHPLSWVARRWSRSLAAAQTVAAVSAGARSVAVADLLGPEFDAHPDTMFGPDQFHPSAAGYRAFGEAIVPSLADAVTATVQPQKSTANLDLAQAAARAAEVGGAEVSGARGSRVRGSAAPATVAALGPQRALAGSRSRRGAVRPAHATGPDHLSSWILGRPVRGSPAR